MKVESEIKQIERDKFFSGPVEVVCDPCMRAHCLDPYHAHPHGCPNWGHKKGCPPDAPLFLDTYAKDVYIAAFRFNFGQYLAEKRERHPDWTDRALRNPRHWQAHVRSDFRRFLAEELPNHPEIQGDVLFSPEAMGVNLFATCQKAGIILEHTPTNFVYNIALIARPNLLK